MNKKDTHAKDKAESATTAPLASSETKPLQPSTDIGNKTDGKAAAKGGGLRFASPGRTISKKTADNAPEPAKAGSGLPTFKIPAGPPVKAPVKAPAKPAATKVASSGKKSATEPATTRPAAAGKSPLHTIARRAAAKRKLDPKLDPVKKAEAKAKPGATPKDTKANDLKADKRSTVAEKAEGPETPEPLKPKNRGLVISLVAAAAAAIAVLWAGSVDKNGVPQNTVDTPTVARQAADDPPLQPMTKSAPAAPSGVAEAPPALPHSDPLPAIPEPPKQFAAKSPPPDLPPPLPPELPPGLISAEELMEIEKLLARLAFDPGTPDGVIDPQSQIAIRLYQEMAGLPVDGEASEELLVDLREVVRLYDTGN